MRPTGSSSRLVALAGVAAAALVLAGCGGDDDKNAGPGPNGPTRDAGCGFHSGPASDSVKVTGDFGGELAATFGKPMKTSGLERTVVTAGTGKETKDGTAVSATVSVFNGRTGDLINRQASKPTVGESTTPQILAAGLRCVPTGSRVVATGPASELFGAEGNPDLGIAAGDGVVVVTDVAEVVKPPKADPWPDAPAVTFDGRRSPEIGEPTGAVPQKVLVDVIRPGTGVKVRAGDQITVNFKTVIWGSGKTVVETYGKGKKPLTYGTNDFVPGFTSAVVGQRAGARLLVAVPPEFGYGAAGAESSGISGDDTLLIVIEIEASQGPAAPTS